MDLLWTNDSPTQVFSPQVVSLDLSGYELIIIITENSIENTTLTANIVFTNIQNNYALKSDRNDNAYRPNTRACSVTSIGVQFATGYDQYPKDREGVANDACCILVYIYGVR